MLKSLIEDMQVDRYVPCFATPPFDYISFDEAMHPKDQPHSA